MHAFAAGGKVASGRAIGDAGVRRLGQGSRQPHGTRIAPPPHVSYRRSGRRGQPVVLNVLNSNLQTSSFWPDDSPSTPPPPPDTASAWSDAVETSTNNASGARYIVSLQRARNT
eukprot:8793053-Pyramimonas_sp.AAC.1